MRRLGGEADVAGDIGGGGDEGQRCQYQCKCQDVLRLQEFTLHVCLILILG